MKSKIALALSALVFSASSFAGTVTVGASPVPHAEILEFVSPILKEQGVDLKVIEFNDYVQPNLATEDGELDANYFQHKPYLKAFSEDHGIELFEVATVHIEPMAVYSNSIKDLKDLKKGGSIGIPNDPTNGGRALLLLAKAGLITLSDPDSITATVMDIKDNPKNLDIKEIEAAQLPRSLDDLDVAVINTNYAIQANLNPLKDAILVEDSNSPYVNILVANKASKDSADMKALIKALQSDKTKKFIEEKYKGAILSAF